MFKIGEVVFAKVKGFCPWPGKIMCLVGSNQFKIFFYGTSQESLVKSDCIWRCKENLDEFSKKYGAKKDYFHALEEMKKTPDVFKVSSSDLCAHQCRTCDPKRMTKEQARGNEGFQMRKSKGVVDIVSEVATTNGENVKVVVKKIKDKAKDKVVAKSKSFQKIVKSKQRIKKEGRSHRDNVFKKLLGKKFNLSEMNNDQVTAKNKSFKKIFNSKQRIEKEVESRQENVFKELHDKESDQVAVDGKAEEGIQQKNAAKIKKKEGRWFCSNETKKEKNLNVEIESNKSKATETQLESLMKPNLPKEIKDLPKVTLCEEKLKDHQVDETTNEKNLNVKIESNKSKSKETQFGKGLAKVSESLMEPILPKEIKDLPKVTMREDNLNNQQDDDNYESELVPVISLKPGSIEVVTAASNNNGSEEILSALNDVDGGEGKLKIYDVKMIAMVESSTRQKFKYTFKEVDMPNASFPYDDITGTVSNVQSQSITSKGVDLIESTENPKECPETTQKIKEPVEINLEDSITEVWLKDDENQNEREEKSMMDIDNIYGEDVLDLDVSYTMFDLSQENGDLSQVSQAGSTGDSFKELMDVETVTEVGDGSPSQL